MISSGFLVTVEDYVVGENDVAMQKRMDLASNASKITGQVQLDQMRDDLSRRHVNFDNSMFTQSVVEANFDNSWGRNDCSDSILMLDATALRLLELRLR